MPGRPLGDDAPAPQWQPVSRFPGRIDSPAPAPEVVVDFGACSRRGPLRASNDDHYWIVRLGRQQETLRSSLPYGTVPPRFDEFASGMVVADGMGRDAEAASRLAIATLAHQSVHFGEWHVRVDVPTAHEILDRAARFFKNVDAALLEAAQGNPAGLRSTLTAVFTAGNELFFAYVGDSPVYLFRNGTLAPLTRNTARAAGAGAAETLGAPQLLRPSVDVERCGLLDGDVVLLCTNGLTDAVADDRIAHALRQPGTAEDQARALVDLAGRSGGHDDVTTVVARYRIRA